MKDYQARGYLFEYEIWRLLEASGYIGVTTAKLRGRGAEHQIDAYGTLSVPTPFLYPIRLICEAKCYSEPVGLKDMRSFVGVLKDISENYFVGSIRSRNTPFRFTEAGCFFSSSSFTVDAQDYAWAHNIFIVSFNNIRSLNPIVDRIKDFMELIPENRMEAMLKKKLIGWYKRNTYLERNLDLNTNMTPSLAIGIIDGAYPVSLIGPHKWVDTLHENIPQNSDIVEIRKTRREDSDLDTTIFLDIFGHEIAFSLPKIVARKLIDRIDKSTGGDKVFDIDIPLLLHKDSGTVRRFLRLEISLTDKSEFIASIKKKP